MKALIRNLKIVLLLFMVLSLALLSGLVIQQYRSRTRLFAAAGENKAALKTRYAAAGRIVDRNGAVLAVSQDGERLYSSDAATAKAVLHIVGDYTHNIANTVEARYQSELLGTDRNVLHQLLLDFTGHGFLGDDITLTIDGSLSKKAAQLLKNRSGAVVLMNYKTGALLAAVSSPGTTPQSVITYKGFPETSLFNRALSGAYAPGSTFKVITAAAWLQSPDYDSQLTVNCQGQSTVISHGAKESDGKHGPVNLETAFSKSCNVFFGQVGASLGRGQLLAAARNFGLGASLSLDRLEVLDSRIETLDDPSVLSWLAIGQPTADSVLQMTPLQMAMIAGAVANAGLMVQPHVIDHLTDPLGIQYGRPAAHPPRTVMNAATAAQLEALMITATQKGTGTKAAVKGRVVAGKTGTAQVEGKANTALFIGYLVDETYPLAIAVVVEEGGSGGTVAAPVAAELFAAACQAG